jgi:hypothetical protein
MVKFSQNKWKYTTISLMAILAVGFSFPQASAHITSNTQHMLQHIYNFVDGIEAKTDNLPEDPASNTVVNTRASQESINALQNAVDGIDLSNLDSSVSSRASQTDTGVTKAKIIEIDTGVGRVRDNTLVAGIFLIPDTDKNLSGHITIASLVSPNITDPEMTVICRIHNSETSMVQVPLASTTDGLINVDFSCNGLMFIYSDVADGTDDPERIIIDIQYVETDNVSIQSIR